MRKQKAKRVLDIVEAEQDPERTEKVHEPKNSEPEKAEGSKK